LARVPLSLAAFQRVASASLNASPRPRIFFETVCDEVAIPPDASSDGDALATKILRAGEEAIESEMILALTVMQTAMKGRR
jgi:uncharacterized protein YfeS